MVAHAYKPVLMSWRQEICPNFQYTLVYVESSMLAMLHRYGCFKTNNMPVCAHICMCCVCIHICVCSCMSMCGVDIHKCMCALMHVYVHIHTLYMLCVHTYVCTCILHIYMRVCVVYTCIYVCMYIGGQTCHIKII